MKTIYKYTLEPVEEQVVIIKGLVRLLSVMEQKEDIVVYALVNTLDVESTKVKIRVVGTGHNANIVTDTTLNYLFLGTVKLHEGALMFHIFYTF